MRVLIVGDNEPGYGGVEMVNALPLRQRMLEELEWSARYGPNPLSWACASSSVDGFVSGELGACLSQLPICAWVGAC